MKKIGITGATGFIGKHFSELLLKDGYDVIAYARNPERLNFLGNPKNLKIVVGRMEDEKNLEAFIASCDAIVHLAAGTKGTWENYHAATVQGTELLLKLAEKHPLQKLIIMSSIGDYDIMRLKRNIADENSPLETQPALRGDYAHSKVLAEHVILKKMELGTVPIILLRTGLVYARNFKAPLMGAGFIRGKRGIGLGIGGKRMPFVHVNDLYDAVRLALRNTIINTTYNVVSDEQPKIRTIVRLYNKYSPAPVKIVFIPKLFFFLNHLLENILSKKSRLGRYNFLLCRTQKNIYYSAEKIKKELGWQPKISFEETMKEMMDFHGSPVRIGVVGCGFAFKTLHLPALKGNPRIQVPMIYDANRSLAEDAQQLFRGAAIPTEADDITKDRYDLDFIALLTPPETHISLAKIFMERGYNLLIEKPLALNADDAEELEMLEKKTGVKICIANNYRFRDNVQKLIETVRDDGIPTELFVKFWSGPVIESEGGWRSKMKNALLYEMAYHLIDIAAFLGGETKKILHLQKDHDKKGTLVSLSLIAETKEKTKLIIDARLFPPHAETYIEARYPAHAYRAGFYPESFRRLSGNTNPLREIKANARTTLNYILSKRRGNSHERLYTLFINALRDHHEEIPVRLSDNIPLLKLLDTLSH